MCTSELVDIAEHRKDRRKAILLNPGGNTLSKLGTGGSNPLILEISFCLDEPYLRRIGPEWSLKTPGPELLESCPLLHLKKINQNGRKPYLGVWA